MQKQREKNPKQAKRITMPFSFDFIFGRKIILSPIERVRISWTRLMMVFLVLLVVEVAAYITFAPATFSFGLIFLLIGIVLLIPALLALIMLFLLRR